VTTNLVVAEVHRFVLFHVGIQPAARALDQISVHPRVRIEFARQVEHDGARAWLAKLADQRITYTDAVSFAVMEATRCTTALAFDRDFSVAGFRLWSHVV
jgi:predicted nucleic acid-binding protein